MENVAVIGAGSWGTAFAGLVAAHVRKVSLWSHTKILGDYLNIEHHNPRYIVNYELPENIVATSDLAEAVAGAEAVFLVVPSTHVRAMSHELAPLLAADVPVVVLAKGIEQGTGFLMSEIVADELGNPQRICVLSGPNHAEEVCRGLPTGAVLAGEDEQLLQHIQAVCASESFRVYLSDDLVGVEICGAVKNVIAIACGVAVGANMGDNTLAMIMTRGLAEMNRLAVAKGANPLTCMGLAGMGDLVATCTSPHSRNRSFGQKFVSGVSLARYESDSHMVVEGAAAARSVLELSDSLGVEMPITRSVYSLLYKGVSVEQAVELLTKRRSTEEFYGIA